MNKGFISVPVLIIILLTGTLVAGGGYTAYKINQIESVNTEKIAELEAKLNQTAATTTPEFVVEVTSTTSSSSMLTTEEDTKPDDKGIVKETVVVKEVVYVPQQTIKTEPEPEEVEIIEEEEVVEVEAETVASVSPISVVAVGQTSYPDGYGGVYGAYGLTIRVQAQDEDIYIPMTTNDSLGSGEIGFNYKVTGQEFRGVQDSEVTQCTNFDGILCKFKVGQNKNLKVTVWLTPDEENSGNYGVNFGTVTYFEGGERKEFVVDRETAKINLYY